ncbi:MAG: LysM peptidoglycan-binding domain-containing protein [Anaerolineales bacterium]
MHHITRHQISLTLLLLVILLLTACETQSGLPVLAMPGEDQDHAVADLSHQDGDPQAGVQPTPLPTRPLYQPGELVDYIAQTGDTLPALAARFNTSVAEILEANPIIPAEVTTLPPGMPMQIPIYYLPLWGSAYQILPDSLFINGPAQLDFNTSEFVASFPGWLNAVQGFASDRNRSGAELVDWVALNYSVSPRLLLALLEYQAGALSQAEQPSASQTYPLGYHNTRFQGVTQQLIWAANTLNDGYYSYRTGELTSFHLRDGSLERPDPWQNAATVALQFYFSRILSPEDYREAISPSGFAHSYQALYGDPWLDDVPHIPGSLLQPEMSLPFRSGTTWAFTGGPHTAWGTAKPWAALDFAPPAVVGGCSPSDELATAIAPGVVIRSETGTVVLDLEGDGLENTGWVIFYFHVATERRAPAGSVLQTGDPIGYPSCEGGRSTGTHIHIARKYNGEWMPASGVLAFNLDGWIAQKGSNPYEGFMTRNAQTVIASESSSAASFISAEEK